jgi:hypothetical protein
VQVSVRRRSPPPEWVQALALLVLVEVGLLA